jgi:hypothetical protein
MIRIKVQYDAQTKTFKLVDKEFRTILEGDGIYDLAIPLVLEDADMPDEFLPSSSHALAHA